MDWTINYKLTILIVITIIIQEIHSTKAEDVEQTTKQHDKILNPLANLILHENEIGDVSRNRDHTKDTLLRVKRQGYYDPYYYPRWPIPIPILFGGGGWFGGRGFGGRGFGGRGFGGRGFGGRGFGGRGFGGGRGIGGFGGRGIGGGFGGGRGGGRG